jgi:hypothetical protein
VRGLVLAGFAVSPLFANHEHRISASNSASVAYSRIFAFDLWSEYYKIELRADS